MALGDACPPRAWPTPGCKYVARERLDMGPGYVIEPGQPFEHALFNMTDLQAELWWTAGILDVAPAAPAQPAQPQAPSAAPVAAPQKPAAKSRR